MSYTSRETSISGGSPFELYVFTTESGTWRLASGDKARTYQGVAYSLEAIFRTNTSQSTEAKGGHVKVTLPQDHPIAQLFVNFIPSTPLYVTVFRNHDGEAESETVVAFTGRVQSGQFTTNDRCEMDCAPESEQLKRRVAAASFQKPCNHILFDEGCTVDKALFRSAAVLTSVSADGITIKSAVFASKPDGWWATGYIEVGADRRMVVSHAGDTLVLMNPLNGLAVGSDLFVYAGCDRTYDGANGCQSKFANGVNFMGWQWIPTKNPFSSGVN